jgi:hypothetical protein
VLTLKFSALWDVTPFILIDKCRRFEETWDSNYQPNWCYVLDDRDLKSRQNNTSIETCMPVA